MVVDRSNRRKPPSRTADQERRCRKIKCSHPCLILPVLQDRKVLVTQVYLGGLCSIKMANEVLNMAVGRSPVPPRVDSSSSIKAELLKASNQS